MREFYTYPGPTSESIVLSDGGRYALSIENHASFWLLQMDSLRQMQNRFAGELPLQQPLSDLSNVVPRSLNRD